MSSRLVIKLIVFYLSLVGIFCNILKRRAYLLFFLMTEIKILKLCRQLPTFCFFPIFIPINFWPPFKNKYCVNQNIIFMVQKFDKY